MKTKAIGIILIMIFLLSSCSYEKQITVPDDVSRISVSPYESPYMTFVYTEDEKIKAVTDFLKSLEAKETNDTPMNYVGAVPYVITLETPKGSTEYTIAGSTFFKVRDGDWMTVPYEKGEEFIEILRNNEPDIKAEKPLFTVSSSEEAD